MSAIQRFGTSPRWSDVVMYGGMAHWVEVAEDLQRPTSGQIAQVLAQIDATLASIGSNRTDLLQTVIYLADLADVTALNEAWDGWVPAGHPPVRACVQAGLSSGCRVEMVIMAACPNGSPPA